MTRSRSHPTFPRSALVALLAFLLGTSAGPMGGAAAQETPPREEASWEFRVCADPRAMPYSSRDEAGFENRLAELLADELGAEVSYDWSAFSADMINLRLRGGECDAIMGVPDGHEGVLTTIAYYRSPYVFVTRADRDLGIESLDDPVLRELRIGVQNIAIPPHDALLNRGIVDNVIGPEGGVPNEPGRVVRDVANGEVDVGITWGPNAGWFAQTVDAELRIEPVTPQFDPPFLSMSLPMTIGVRRGDASLRDRLDLALAARWEDVQRLLDEYGVPRMPIPAPVASLDADPEGTGPVRAGVVLPMTTGATTNLRSLYDLVGDAALAGVELATSDVAAGSEEDPLRLSVSSAPSAASARRAAERMLAVGDAEALIGGLGEGQAETLAEVATTRGVLFLDVGSTSPLLRRRCYPTTFHVEADARAYLDALVGRHAEEGVRRWAVVHERGDAGEAYAEAARAAVEARGGTVVETLAVDQGQPYYGAEVDRVAEADADAVLPMLHPADQIAFQAEAARLDAVTAPLSSPVEQTRDYLAAARGRAGATEPQVRVVAWEPTRPGGEEIGERFVARFGQPMQASAFAGYQAVLVLDQALAAAGRDVAGLVAHLSDPETTVEGPKGELAFSGRQLVQPLDAIRVDPDAEWRNTVEGKLGIASHLATIAPRQPEDASGPPACPEE